ARVGERVASHESRTRSIDDAIAAIDGRRPVGWPLHDVGAVGGASRMLQLDPASRPTTDGHPPVDDLIVECGYARYRATGGCFDAPGNQHKTNEPQPLNHHGPLPS